MATPHLFARFGPDDAGDPSAESAGHARAETRPEQHGDGTDPGRYNQLMTTTLTPAVPADHTFLPSSYRLAEPLTDADATRIAAAAAAAHAASTRAVYAYAWRQWETWCASRGLAPLPATPAVVCAYLTERAAQGVPTSTIDLACSAIGHHHRHRGHPDPITHETVRRVRRGLRRTLGTAPRRPARPLGIAQLRQIITRIDRTTAPSPRCTPGSPTAAPHPVPCSPACAEAPPVSRSRPPPLRRGWSSSGPRPPGSEPNGSPDTLRAGHATTAARAGVGVDRIAAQTRPRRIEVLVERYIRPAQALERTSSRDLGL
jgi:hypothetical protein